MNTDNSIASFWNAYVLAGKTPKLLAGGRASMASDIAADDIHADEIPDDILQDVSE